MYLRSNTSCWALHATLSLRDAGRTLCAATARNALFAASCMVLFLLKGAGCSQTSGTKQSGRYKLFCGPRCLYQPTLTKLFPPAGVPWLRCCGKQHD